LEEIKLGSKEKKGLKNKLAKGNKRTTEDFTTNLLGAVSATEQIKSFSLLSSL